MWAALGAAFVAVFVLGLMGFTRYQLAAGAMEPLATRAYLAVQLFTLESGAVAGSSLPWQLQVARFAAPLVAGYAVVQTLASVFRAQVDALRLQFVRDHVVVAGLGRKGRLLVEALLRRGERVVVIEADTASAELDTTRAIGALVVIGDARSPDTQRRAGLDRASHLVALCGDDATNAEVVARARQHVDRRRSGDLHCVAHVVDAQLSLLLCSEELERYGQAPVRVDFVNVYGVAARALLRAQPAFPRAGDAVPRVVIVGSGPTARHLLVAIARAWATRGDSTAGQRLPVSMMGADRSWVAELERRHCEVPQFTDVQVADSGAAVVADGVAPVVYVCPDDDAAAASAALELRGALLGRPARVIVIVEQYAGLGHLLRGAPQPPGGPAMTTFGLLDEACQPDVLLAGTTELLAQALHRTYLDAHADAGSMAGDPALRPWSELPEALRASNRDHAAHVAVKLAAVRRTIGPVTDWDAAERDFSDREVELMARLEHDRWVAEREKAGWRPGPRDPHRRTTPYLVAWEELTEDIRDKDRMFVRQLPRILASVGLQAHPLARAHPLETAHTQQRLATASDGSPAGLVPETPRVGDLDATKTRSTGGH